MLDIDWSKVPEKYNWAAQDEDGCVYAYIFEPRMVCGCGLRKGMWNAACSFVYFVRVGKKNPNFHKTLTKRPEK